MSPVARSITSGARGALGTTSKPSRPRKKAKLGSRFETESEYGLLLQP